MRFQWKQSYSRVAYDKRDKKSYGAKRGQEIHPQTVPKIGSRFILPNPVHPIQKKQYHGQEVQQIQVKKVEAFLLPKKQVHTAGSQKKKCHTEQECTPFTQPVTQGCHTIPPVFFVLVDLRQRVQRPNQQAR